MLLSFRCWDQESARERISPAAIGPVCEDRASSSDVISGAPSSPQAATMNANDAIGTKNARHLVMRAAIAKGIPAHFSRRMNQRSGKAWELGSVEAVNSG